VCIPSNLKLQKKLKHRKYRQIKIIAPDGCRLWNNLRLSKYICQKFSELCSQRHDLIYNFTEGGEDE